MSMIIKYDRLYKENYDIKEIEYEKGFGDPNYHYTLNQADRVASIIQRLEALGWAGSKQAPKTKHPNNIHST